MRLFFMVWAINIGELSGRGTDFHSEKIRGGKEKRLSRFRLHFFPEKNGGGYSFKVALGCCMLASSDAGSKKKEVASLVVIFVT